MIRKIIGGCFILFGLIWSISEKYLCRELCQVCNNQQLSPCFFLFLFVGIIFVVIGASLSLSSVFKKVKDKK